MVLNGGGGAPAAVAHRNIEPHVHIGAPAVVVADFADGLDELDIGVEIKGMNNLPGVAGDLAILRAGCFVGSGLSLFDLALE